jgi:hypothetical protein
LGRTLPSTLAFDFPNVVALVDYVAGEVLGLAPTIPSAQLVENDVEGEDLKALEQLSEAEAEATLLRELEELEELELSS